MHTATTPRGVLTTSLWFSTQRLKHDVLTADKFGTSQELPLRFGRRVVAKQFYEVAWLEGDHITDNLLFVSQHGRIYRRPKSGRNIRVRRVFIWRTSNANLEDMYRSLRMFSAR